MSERAIVLVVAGAGLACATPSSRLVVQVEDSGSHGRFLIEDEILLPRGLLCLTLKLGTGPDCAGDVRAGTAGGGPILLGPAFDGPAANTACRGI
jgi:hypothetical protein